MARTEAGGFDDLRGGASARFEEGVSDLTVAVDESVGGGGVVVRLRPAVGASGSTVSAQTSNESGTPSLSSSKMTSRM